MSSAAAKVIGVVTADIANPFFGEIAKVIEAEAQRHGYAVLIASTGEDPARERTYLPLMRDRGVDGLIVTPCDTQSLATLLAFREAGLHSLLLDRDLPGRAFDSVHLDNHAAGVAAVELAVAMGHRRIGMIGGTTGLSVSDDRVRGYADALRAAGLPDDRSLVADGRLSIDGGYEGARRLLASAAPPTAIVAGSNLMMIGLMNCIVQMGLRCPSEVSVLSIDDVPWAESFMPRLTAVAQPVREMGRRAVELLVERMTQGGDRPTVQKLFQPQLRMRDSVAPPPR
jgi:LacI family transcriptional regulator